MGWRHVLPLLILAGAGPASAAPAEDLLAAHATMTSVAPRRNCIAANADEITVCGRRRDNLRYRLPSSPPKPGSRAAVSVGGERFELMQHRAEGGIGSCSPIGPGGWTGCTFLEWRREQEAGERSPGLVRRVLTYLDPDE